MRGEDQQNHTLFSYVRPDSRVPTNHPLRVIREIVNTALKSLSARFDALYAREGRPRYHPSGYCAPCFCRRSTRYDPSAS